MARKMWTVAVIVADDNSAYNAKQFTVIVKEHPDHGHIEFRSRVRRYNAKQDAIEYLIQVANLLGVDVTTYEIKDGAGNLIDTRYYLNNNDGEFIANVTISGVDE